MYAIVQSGSKQYRVEPGSIVRVEKLAADLGKEVTFPALWVVSEGEPSPSGKSLKAKVVAEVLRHLRAPKVLVFKKRSKKGYKKLQGHRQWLTELRIKEISLAQAN